MHPVSAPHSPRSSLFRERDIHFRYTWSVRLFYQGGRERGREGASVRYVAILGLFVEAVRQPERGRGRGQASGRQAARLPTGRQCPPYDSLTENVRNSQIHWSRRRRKSSNPVVTCGPALYARPAPRGRERALPSRPLSRHSCPRTQTGREGRPPQRRCAAPCPCPRPHRRASVRPLRASLARSIVRWIGSDG